METARCRMLGAIGLMSAALVGVRADAGGQACPCSGDVSGDGTVDGGDLGALLAAWGPCPGCAEDLSGDGVVDGADLGIVLSAWGPCTGGPPNDACADAVTVVSFTGSANPFCTIGATTDGPALPGGCAVPPIESIDHDVWFRVTAPVTGTLQFGACADFDVRLAVYREVAPGQCSCSAGGGFGPVLACAGTAAYPACPSGAAAIVPVEAGDCLLVRVGGADGATGTGNLDINVYVPPCEIVSGSTLAANGLEANAEFGIAIDISGDVAVATAIFDDLLFVGNAAGSARVYRHDGASWAAEATLLSPELFAGEGFGVSAAADGDWIVVGSRWIDDTCAPSSSCDTGRASIYHFDGDGWSLDQGILPLEGSPKDKFGARVDIDFPHVLVAAWDDDNANGVRAGAAYAYRWLVLFGGFWAQSAKLMASDGAQSDGFGSDVAVSGDWAVVGADGVGASNTGAAYLFLDGDSSWEEVQKLQPASLPGGANFGRAVDIDGGVALVAAPGGSGAGAVYVYEDFGPLGWLQTAVLQAHDGTSGNQFGASVSVSGNQAIVGSPGADGGIGAAYVFYRVSGGWVERAKLVAPNGASGDQFAIVAIDGGRGLVGAYLDNVGLASDVGTVHVFNGLGECTGNGVPDACDIAAGLPDGDGDGIPDVCEP